MRNGIETVGSGPGDAALIGHREVGSQARVPGEGRFEGTLRVAVLDASSLFARALAASLGPVSEGRVSVVGTAATLSEGVRLVAETSPDLLLVDLTLPPAGATGLVRAIHPRPSTLRVLVMASADDFDGVAAALEAGADAFVSKSSRPEQLLAPLLAVRQGWSVAPRPLVDHLLTRYRRPGADLLATLDSRDKELWILVAEGHEISGIAERLYVSERTVKRLVADLRGRLGVSSRIEMASLAGRAGLLDDRMIGGAPTGVDRRRTRRLRNEAANCAGSRANTVVPEA